MGRGGILFFLLSLLLHFASPQNNCSCPCASPTPASGPSTVTVCPCVQRENYRFRLLGGSQNHFAESTFWDEVTKGFKRASNGTRAQAEIQFTTQQDDTKLTLKDWFTQQIQAAVDDGLHGVLVSLDLSVSDFIPLFQQLKAANILYFTLGPGMNQLPQFPFEVRPPLHIGSDPILSGQEAAKQVIKAGKGGNCICLRHQLSLEYDTICSAFVQYINANGGKAVTQEYTLWSQNQEAWKQLVTQKKDQLTSIFVLTPSVAELTMQILSDLNSNIYLGTMHFSPGLWSKLGNRLGFLISQQPYLQGMFSAYSMVQYLTRASLPLAFDTGPIVLTSIPKIPVQKSGKPRPSIEFVVHQQFDPFWTLFHNSIREAVDDGNHDNPLIFLNETYTSNVPTEQARLIKKYCAYADGLMTSIPESVVVPAAIQACIEGGTQVISVNSGSDDAKNLKVITHVGQLEDVAGRRAAEELIRLGMKVGMCMNNEGAPRIRCDSFNKAVVEAGLSYLYPNPDMKNLTYFTISSSSASQTVDLVTDWLTKNLKSGQPVVDGILVTGTESPIVAKGINQAGRRGKVFVCTFDLTPEIFQGINSGDIHLAIDQQPAMQAYLPGLMFEAFFLNGNVTTTFPMQTGPFFVSKGNYDGKFCQSEAQCSKSVQYQGPDLVMEDGTKFTNLPVALFSSYNKSAPPYTISGQLVDVGLGCDLQTDAGQYSGKILLMTEGDCFFFRKAKLASDAKAAALIIGRAYATHPPLNMTAGTKLKVPIPVLSVDNTALKTLRALNGKSAKVDATKYAPLATEPTWKRIGKSAYIALTVIAGILQVSLIPLVIAVIIFKSSPSIKHASPTFLIIIAFGCFVELFSVYFFGIDGELFDVGKLSSFCTLQIWFVGCGFVIIVGSLIAKSWRIHSIFHNATELKSSASLTDGELIKMLAILLCGEIIILAVWTGVDQFRYTLNVEAGTQYYKCTTGCTGCVGAWIGYKGLLILVALYLAFSTRNVDARFRESQIILFSMYTITVFTGIAVIMILVVTNPEALFLIESILVIIFVVSFMTLQYLTKIYYAFTGASSSSKGSTIATISTTRNSTHST